MINWDIALVGQIKVVDRGVYADLSAIGKYRFVCVCSSHAKINATIKYVTHITAKIARIAPTIAHANPEKLVATARAVLFKPSAEMGSVRAKKIVILVPTIVLAHPDMSAIKAYVGQPLRSVAIKNANRNTAKIANLVPEIVHAPRGILANLVCASHLL
jgi:hypothetical protein